MASILKTIREKVRLLILRQDICAIAVQLPIEDRFLPTFGFSEQSGRPHIELGRSCYYYVVCERGQEFDRMEFVDREELLFHIFSKASLSAGIDYECKHRKDHLDSRQVIYQKQVELMARHSTAWADRMRKKQEGKLESYPQV